MKRLLGFTLLEILIVVAILGIASTVGLWNFVKSSNNQQLVSDSEQLTNIFKEAHIYSREFRSEKTWGVRSINTNSYALISYRSGESEFIEREYFLQYTTRFATPFSVVFERGSGALPAPIEILLQNSLGIQKKIYITQTGVVDIVP